MHQSKLAAKWYLEWKPFQCAYLYAYLKYLLHILLASADIWRVFGTKNIDKTAVALWVLINTIAFKVVHRAIPLYNQLRCVSGHFYANLHLAGGPLNYIHFHR